MAKRTSKRKTTTAKTTAPRKRRAKTVTAQQKKEHDTLISLAQSVGATNATCEALAKTVEANRVDITSLQHTLIKLPSSEDVKSLHAALQQMPCIAHGERIAKVEVVARINGAVAGILGSMAALGVVELVKHLAK